MQHYQNAVEIAWWLDDGMNGIVTAQTVLHEPQLIRYVKKKIISRRIFDIAMFSHSLPFNNYSTTIYSQMAQLQVIFCRVWDLQEERQWEVAPGQSGMTDTSRGTAAVINTVRITSSIRVSLSTDATMQNNIPSSIEQSPCVAAATGNSIALRCVKWNSTIITLTEGKLTMNGTMMTGIARST
jgi:hypothetical protein